MSAKDQDLYSQTQSYYESHAAELFQSYGSVESPLSNTINAQFKKGERLLDIGCGSGRDLKALHDSGYEVYGLDGSREFIRLAKEKYPELAKRFHHGSIPDEFPPALNRQGEDRNTDSRGWDGIICSAVLQHIPDNLVFDCFFLFQRQLEPGGRLVISVPGNYPVRDDQDARGRLFKIRPVEEYDHLLRRIGFTPLHKEESSDSLNRSGITWVKLVYRKESQDGLRPIDKIESFIREDSKVSSYKFALLRALGELASSTAHLARWQTDGSVRMDILPIIHKWIEYYWPLLQTKDNKIIFQGQKPENKNDISFRTELQELIDHWNIKEDGWRKFRDALERESFSSTEEQLYKAVKSKIRTALINGPVKYMGNARTGSIFSHQGSEITLPAEFWTEFTLMGRWFEDSLMLRWAEFCGKLNKNSVETSEILAQMISLQDIKRSMGTAEKIYAGIEESHTLSCVWSDKSFPSKKGYDIDHAIPFSIWRNNALWNLFPADKKVNNQKRAKLPSRNFLLSREDKIREYWDLCYDEERQLFSNEIQTLSGKKSYNKEVARDLFRIFCEQVEILALQNSVERWEI